MFILLHINNEDYCSKQTIITTSKDKEKLEKFIKSYKILREVATGALSEFSKIYHEQRIAQRKNREKLAPFNLNLSKNFYPFDSNCNIDNFLYRPSREENSYFYKEYSSFEKSFGFPIVAMCDDRSEEFIIIEVPEI